MSSKYPVLGNRPIDQWKVTELKEELKRRKLTTKGLKDDLIKRLNEAIRAETEAEMVVNAPVISSQTDIPKAFSNVIGDDSVHVATDALKALKSADKVKVGTTRPKFLEDFKDASIADNLPEVVSTKVHDVSNHQEETIIVNSSSSRSDVVKDKVIPGMASEESHKVVICDLNFTEVEESPGKIAPVLMRNSFDEGYDAEAKISVVDSLSSENLNNGNTISSEVGNVDLKSQMDSSEPISMQEGFSIESSTPIYQVPEVNQTLGFQVNLDSNSTDLVSINEKNELKDNKIDDTVKLEYVEGKSEAIDPSPGNVASADGESHPLDGEEPPEKALCDEEHGNNAVDADVSKKSEIVDFGDSEKLNLDRSSGDDSDEDIMEGKDIDSKNQSCEMSDKTITSLMNDGGYDGVMDKDMFMEHNQLCDEGMMHPVSEKRKHHDNDSTVPQKKQRRWNSERLYIPETESLDNTLKTTPNETPVSAPKRNFSRSDSSITEEPSPMRTVPPSQKPPTNSLRVDRFLRPFTLKAVQELLSKTGKVENFWMDQIKTHCYVTYASVDEAIATREAIYNLQWPANGGRNLVAEFVDLQEVKARLETQSSSAAVSSGEPAHRQAAPRQRFPSPAPPLANISAADVSRPAPPPPEEAPMVTLDDLFRKTKTTPRIYYLPLSEEQVAAKRGEEGKEGGK